MKRLLWLSLLLAAILGAFPSWAVSPVPSDKYIKAPAILSREATLTWTRTQPSSEFHQSMVVLQEVGVSNTTPLPMEGQYYIANQYFGLGQQIGPGEYVVHADTARIVVVKGLKPGTRYRADVISMQTDTLAAPFEWQVPPRYTYYQERDSTATMYFTTLPAPGVPAPTQGATAPQATALDCSTLQLSVRPGNGDGRLMVVQPVQSRADGASKPTAPVDDVYYLASQNYGQGQTVGQDAYTVQLGTDTTLTVYGVVPGNLYKFVVYEYSVEKDANGQPNGGGITYVQATDTAYVQVTACSTQEPDQPATRARQTDTTTTTAQVMWHNGSGQGRLVVVREFTQGRLMPTQNTSYRGNPRFGLGDQTDPGSFVVQVGTDSVLNLTGLQPGSLYQLEVYEYNIAADGRPTYLLSKQPASTMVVTKFPPVGVVEAPSKLRVEFKVAFTYDGGLIKMHWHPGSGANYLALIREVRPGRAPLPLPQDGTRYPTNNTQIMDAASHLGSGCYVLRNAEYQSTADSVVYLRNPVIGHEYEVALYEYDLDAQGLPEYSSAATLTFTAARFAPVLRGKMAGTAPSFTWYTDALYKPDAYELEYSYDGVTFSPNGSRQAVGMDSSTTRVSGAQALAVPMATTTYFRLRLSHQDFQNEYSNVVRLEPAKPLPVTLTSFKGRVDARSYAQLAWSTASELNSAYFEVQRSQDGIVFTVIGRRTAAGTTSSPRSYDFSDPAVLLTPTYYRLRQVDRDSADYFTNVVTLQPVRQQEVTLTVWPNPARAQQLANLRLTGLQGTAPVEVRIYSAHGQLIRQGQVKGGPVVEWNWSLQDFPAGLYLVEVRSSAGRHTARLVVE